MEHYIIYSAPCSNFSNGLEISSRLLISKIFLIFNIENFSFFEYTEFFGLIVVTVVYNRRSRKILDRRFFCSFGNSKTVLNPKPF